MKIVTILGSARRRGNTATVLRWFEQQVASPHQLERINLGDYAVHGCLGCNACQRTPEGPGCVQDDDGLAVLQRLLTAELIVYATPLYVWSFSAQMKALLDRQYCLVKWRADGSRHSLFSGKRAALLVTCGGTADGDADLIPVMFERAMAYARCAVAGLYVVANCTTPQALGDEAKRVAHAMASDLLNTVERPDVSTWR